MIVKIGPLLAHYLYANKRLDLPSLGTFYLDNSINIEPENNKQSKNILLEGVTFESNPSIKEPPEELIQYISTHSGRIKPLATADLDSYLWLALQFLNIGKPYLLEGVGSLSKINAGGFSFTPGPILTERLSDYVAKEAESKASREADDNYRNIFYSEKPRAIWKKPVSIVLILAGIALAVWGGYTVYKNTTSSNDFDEKEKSTNQKENKMSNDSLINQQNSSIDAGPKTPEGKNKFILTVTDRVTALKRFEKLKKYLWDVQLETKDSISYKIFMLLPGIDTAKVKDSLSLLNGKKVYIER